MTESANMSLPLLSAEQALKHVTHNEALVLLDGLAQLSTEELNAVAPPESPVEGAVYGIAPSPAGEWAGHGGELAIWTPGGWRFAAPRPGWRLWDKATGELHVHMPDGWTRFAQAVPGLQDVGLLGVNATADATNRFALRAPAALFNALEADNGGSGDIRLTLNRQTATDTASLVFQSGWSGRAEIGIAGTDDFAFKVSADGANFATGMSIAAETGFVTFNQMFGAASSSPVVNAGVLNVTTSLAVPLLQNGTTGSIHEIAGGFEGALLVLTGSSGQTLTCVDGSGNLRLGGDRVLAGAHDTLTLMRRGGDWLELSYAGNA